MQWSDGPMCRIDIDSGIDQPHVVAINANTTDATDVP